MNTEQQLRLLLSEEADRVHADRSLRDEALSTARRGRRRIAATAVLGLVSVVVIGLTMAGSPRQETPQLLPVDRPTEHGAEDDDEEPVTDVLVAEARDGSWTLHAGLSEDGETLCLSLGGTGCTSVDFDKGFVLLQSYGSPEERGFIYGPVAADVVTLELGTGGGVVPLRLRDFPNELGVDDLRYFVHPIEEQGAGTVLAKDAEGFLIQSMEFDWGGDAASQASRARAFVRAFMERRILGSGAEGFLDSGGRAAFSSGGPVAPLYPEFRVNGYEIVFMDETSEGSYEVGVRFFFSQGSQGHTYGLRDLGERFVVSGGRRGLEGP